ncbi:MAG: peptidylprolyl isomerase [Caldimicrobium sp.]|nr:peptidylprolyl isomerase [Caldimicrobium sp.]MDW8182271.1 peptidylprolyl isomerase [Caldimicrobium sp.]
MKKFFSVITIFIILALASCKGKEKDRVSQIDKNQVVAKVGEVQITLKDIKEAIELRPPEERELYRVNKALLDKFVEDWVYMELLSQEAKKRNLENDPDFKAKLEQQKKILLAQELIKRDFVPKLKISDKEAKEYYEKNKEHYKLPKRYRVSHIQVKEEKDIKAVQERLKKGEPFEKLAKEVSIDKERAKEGGSLGYLEEGKMPPEFEKVLKGMKPGQISGPVKTPFGWHILKLEEIKEPSYIEFKTLKESIKNILVEEKREKLMEEFMAELRKKHKVEINKALLDELFVKGQI